MKMPMRFRIVAGFALLWNLLGCLAFVSDLLITPEDIATLSQAEQALYAARPAWTIAATAVAVIGGAIGCLGLLLGKKWAFALLCLSMAGIVVQDYGLFVLINGAELAGTTAVVLQSIVFAVGVLLVLLARRGIARGWLG